MPRRLEPIIARTFEDARAALDAEPRIALDLETSGFSPWRDRIHVVALYGAESNTLAILHYPREVPVDPELLQWLSQRPEIVMHNGVQFDALFLANAGMCWEHVAIYDTMIGEQACTVSERHELGGDQKQERRGMAVGLAKAIQRRLHVIIDKTIDHGRWGAPELDLNQLAYVMGDIVYMLRLREAQFVHAAQLDARGVLKYDGMRECIEFEMTLAKVVLQMQLTGLTIDRSAVEAYLAEIRENDRDLEPRLRTALACTPEEIDAYLEARDPVVLKMVKDLKPAKVAAAVKSLENPQVSSTRASALARLRQGDQLLSGSAQLQAMFAIRFGDGVFPTTDKELLTTYAQTPGEIGSMCADLLRWRQISKRESMFSDEWFDEHVVQDGDRSVIHGNFLQLGTNTGRFAARDPNMQQIPKDMRQCFGNRPGWAFGHSDYMGIELRVIAALAKDRTMIEAFAANEDIHATAVAAAFRKPIRDVTPAERRIGKALNFTLTFGGTWRTFHRYARVHGANLTEEDAEGIFSNMLHRFEGVAAMRERAEHYFNSRGFIMLTFPTGLRRQLIPGTHKHTMMLNSTVQAIAAAGIKYAMLEARNAGLSSYLVATVHDELDYEAPLDEIEQVRKGIDAAMLRGMQYALRWQIPVMLGVESSWGPTWKENTDTLRVSMALSQPA